MLDSKEFVKLLIRNNYDSVCAVPCSFLKGLINSVINSNNIEYIPAASEAIACSIASGLKISGRRPIVLSQSSGLTNMASCITSLVKPYDIKFPIITSWRSYNEGDSEIQHQHLSKRLLDLIDSYGYEYEILDSDNLDHAIKQLNNCNHIHSICVVKEGTFSPCLLEERHMLDLSNFPKRSEYLKILNQTFQNDANMHFIGTTGNTSREMYHFMDKTSNFYMAGNMGGALSLGLGMGMSNKNIIVCGGDAEFVMHLGGLSTSGRYINKTNLKYIIFDNEQNKSTGGQNTYQNHIDYIGIAESCSFSPFNKTIVDVSEFAKVIKSKKFNFYHVKCSEDKEEARPPLEKIRRNKL